MRKKNSASDEKVREALKISGGIPTHIAIIMDGNGRWAKKRGLPRVAGHKRGVDTVKEIVEACAEVGVKYLTLYTFSTENWNRPKDEVSTLMRLLLNSLRHRMNELNDNDIRLTTIGNTESLPLEVQKQLYSDIERTKNNKKMVLNLALSYSGRWELLEAIKQIANSTASGKIKTNDIDEKLRRYHEYCIKQRDGMGAHYHEQGADAVALSDNFVRSLRCELLGRFVARLRLRIDLAAYKVL